MNLADPLAALAAAAARVIAAIAVIAVVALGCGCGRSARQAEPAGNATRGERHEHADPERGAAEQIRGADLAANSASGDDDGSDGAGRRTGDGDAGDRVPRCKARSLARPLRFPEASGATYVPDPEAPYILIVGDSGRRGQMARVDIATGTIAGTFTLPLDAAASDDLEGLSMIGDTLYGITSSGWMRHWRLAGTGWELARPAYALSKRQGGERPLVCDSGKRVNCARNYEGLCLRHDATPGQGCAGFAASKSDGALYCLTLAEDGALTLDAGRTIAVSAPETLTGCHFEPRGPGLWAGSNLIGGNRVVRITGWQAPRRARVREVGPLGTGFPEALAVTRDRLVFRFSDTGRSISLVDSYICE